MSNKNKSSTSLVYDLESEIFKTISMRREYSSKIITNYAKTLDLKYETLKKTKFIVEDIPSAQNEKVKTDQNQNILSLIREPKKIKMSNINEMIQKRKEINEALHVLEMIDKAKKAFK